MVLNDFELVLSELISSPELIPEDFNEYGFELYLDLVDKKFSTEKSNSNLFIGFYFVYDKQTLIDDLKSELERAAIERRMRENGLI
jgi:hypothetical protein